MKTPNYIKGQTLGVSFKTGEALFLEGVVRVDEAAEESHRKYTLLKNSNLRHLKDLHVILGREVIDRNTNPSGYHSLS